MSTKRTVMAVCSFLFFTALSISANAQKDPVSGNAGYTYVDLYTGETINVFYDTLTWKTINKATLSPVDYYIIKYPDRENYDTVHGVTGLVTNGLILQKDGKWQFDDAKVKWDGKELKIKDRYGRKVKWEAGQLKVTDWNSKYKSEKGDDTKYKQEWDKIKWKEDGSSKTEVGTKKVKTEQ